MKNTEKIEKLKNEIVSIKKDEVTEIIANKRNILYKYHHKLIQLIDEPLMKYKLREMYFENFPDEYDKEANIKKLEEEAERLGYTIQKK